MPEAPRARTRLEVPRIGDGTAYEFFTRDMVEGLSQKQDLETLHLERNVTVQGAATRHQLDVWWEFRRKGEAHRMAFQCKSLRRRVNKGQALEFFGVLTDLGDVHGIIVSQQEFQRGALEVIRHYEQMGAFELRFPTERDWVGRVRNVHMAMEFHSCVFRRFKPDFASSEAERMLKDYPTTFLEQFPDEVEVTTAEGSVEPLSKRLAENSSQWTSDWQPYEITFPEGSSLLIGPPERLPVEIKRLSYEMRETVGHDVLSIQGDRAIGAILRDPISGSELTFDRFGVPRGQFEFPFPD